MAAAKRPAFLAPALPIAENDEPAVGGGVGSQQMIQVNRGDREKGGAFVSCAVDHLVESALQPNAPICVLSTIPLAMRLSTPVMIS